MPFQSEAQRRLLWAKHPDIAKRWASEYGSTPVSSKKNAAVRKMKKLKGE